MPLKDYPDVNELARVADRTRIRQHQRIEDLTGPVDRLTLQKIRDLLESKGAVAAPGESEFDMLCNFLSSRSQASDASITVSRTYKQLRMAGVAMTPDTPLEEGVITLQSQRDRLQDRVRALEARIACLTHEE